MIMGKALLYFNTIKRMKPIQVAARLRRVKAVNIDSVPRMVDDISISMPTDFNENYTARFDTERLMKSDELKILNAIYKIDLRKWNVDEASHLWNFNFHYFEYAIALGVEFRKTGSPQYWHLFKKLIESWVQCCEYPKGDAWHPYTISLRLINWLVCRDLFKSQLEEDSGFDETMQASMYRQYRHLLSNQETGLLANHYFENLKTLVVMSQYFKETDVFEEAWQSFVGQLNEQILPDGVHFERSMMYHKLVVEGLMRVALVLRQTQDEVPGCLQDKMQAMLDAVASIEKGMGKTPFFNDSADGIAKESADLIKCCDELFGLRPVYKTSFPDSGFYKLYDGDAALVFFAGDPGPSYMLGHSHCDLLSFELSVAGKPTIVNSGTYAYQSELRPYFRSTAAHNTATIDGDEQMECWAEHRVARGVSAVRVEECDGTRIVASFRNYKGLLHRRRVEMCGGLLTVEDSTDGPGAEIVQHFHLLLPELVSIKACDSRLETMSKSVYSAGFGVQSAITEVGIVGLEKASVSMAFGRRYDD